MTRYEISDLKTKISRLVARQVELYRKVVIRSSKIDRDTIVFLNSRIENLHTNMHFFYLTRLMFTEKLVQKRGLSFAGKNVRLFQPLVIRHAEYSRGKLFCRVGFLSSDMLYRVTVRKSLEIERLFEIFDYSLILGSMQTRAR